MKTTIKRSVGDAPMLTFGRISRLLVILCLAASATFCSAAAPDVLTIEETLGGIFIGGSEGVSVAKAANPAAKPLLLKLLDKHQLREHHYRIYFMLGYIAESDDAKTLEQHVQRRFVGIMEVTQWRTIDNILRAFSIMGLRGVPEANTILARMTDPGYWQNTEMELAAGYPLAITNELAVRALLAYARAGNPDWEFRLQELKKKLPESKPPLGMEGRLDVARISEDAKEFREDKAKPISPTIRELLPKLFNGDMDNPGPARRFAEPDRSVGQGPDPDQDARATVVRALAPAEIGSLKIEALNSFSKILEALYADKYEELAVTLADNGKPLVPAGTTRAMARALRKLREGDDLNRTKEIVKALKPLTSVHGEIRGEILSDGTSVVRIPCLGSEGIAKKHFPNDSGRLAALDGQGRLNIVMIKQNGHWYWNPFGW